MLITFPQQAACADRRKVTRGPDPGQWFVPLLPAGWSVHSFHFFVNWTQNPPVLGENLWLTRLVNFAPDESPESVNAADLLSVFTSGVHASALESAGQIFARYGQQVIAVLLPEIPVGSVEDCTPVWMIAYPVQERSVVVISLSELKGLIQFESGGPVQIGSKGLTYGTSAVECVLSHSDSAYPGDVDAVIVDDKGVIRGVVEYKKHNLDSPLGGHLMNRYYPSPDGRKYKRLQSLVLHYRQTTSQIPFVVLYYSTRSPVIRLQEIGELLPDKATITRDSGDLIIDGMTESEVAAMTVKWLGFTP